MGGRCVSVGKYLRPRARGVVIKERRGNLWVMNSTVAPRFILRLRKIPPAASPTSPPHRRHSGTKFSRSVTRGPWSFPERLWTHPPKRPASEGAQAEVGVRRPHLDAHEASWLPASRHEPGGVDDGGGFLEGSLEGSPEGGGGVQREAPGPSPTHPGGNPGANGWFI